MCTECRNFSETKSLRYKSGSGCACVGNREMCTECRNFSETKSLRYKSGSGCACVGNRVRIFASLCHVCWNVFFV